MTSDSKRTGLDGGEEKESVRRVRRTGVRLERVRTKREWTQVTFSYDCVEREGGNKDMDDVFYRRCLCPKVTQSKLLEIYKIGPP